VEIIEEAAARRVDRIGAKPTIISRDMMISCTGMFDAWACYDDRAVGTRLGHALRRPAAERTQANRTIAIGIAACRCLEDLYPEDTTWIDAKAVTMGIDHHDRDADPAHAAGIGNLVAAALLSYRHHDGANQLGDESGSDHTPYADYTYYRPTRGPDEPLDPDSWRPIPFSDGKGGIIRPGFLTPHWYRVAPVGLVSADQFRPPPPPKADSAQMRTEVDECIACNAHLTIEQKAVVEFMRDGPRSTGQSGHWLRFAQDLSHRDRYDLDQDVKLFFCVASVAFDAFIACWDAKRYYNTSRPYWYVRYLKKGQLIQGYAGPGLGVKTILADDLPHTPLSRLLLRPCDSERGRLQDPRALQRQRPLRCHRPAVRRSIDGAGNPHGPNPGRRGEAGGERPRFLRRRSGTADLLWHRRSGRLVPHARRLPYP
jgi:hypothetical protein